MRKEFERVSPESVGLHSSDILHLVEALEKSGTEMHGLMVMRHGKVAAEGWWNPFGPGIRHGLQSHTKTYAATGLGIAYTEGLVKLDERIIDIFPEDAPAEPSENLKLLTVRDVLCMGCGMDTMPFPTEHWIRDFLATPVVHKPGTAYMYNSTGSSLLCAIVEKKTGRKFNDYLTEKLFNRIGIDPGNIRWYNMPDGTAMGGGGMFATTEDNLRLMKVYADGGVFEGERILAEDYVKLATSNQNDSATEAIGNPLATDNHLGYGFQIWMCKPEGVYRADGAMGQFTIVCPKQDLIIAINETAQTNKGETHWAQNTLNLCWEYLEKVDETLKEGVDPLPADPENEDILKRKMASLALPNPQYQPFSPCKEAINGKKFCHRDGNVSLKLMSFMAPAPVENARAFTFCFEAGAAVLDLEQEDGSCQSFRIGTNGTRFTNICGAEEDQTRLLLLDGAWVKENVFKVNARWVETCFVKKLEFRFSENECEIAEVGNKPVFGKLPDPAHYVKEA